MTLENKDFLIIRLHSEKIDWCSGEFSLHQATSFLKYHLKGYTTLGKGAEKVIWLSELMNDSTIEILSLSESEIKGNLRELYELYPTNVCCENHKTICPFLGPSAAVCALKNCIVVRKA